jgi:hypothetical protein
MLRRAARRAGSWGAALHQGASPCPHGFTSSLHALPCITAVPCSGGHGVTAGVRAATARNSFAGFAARALHTAQPSPSASDVTDDLSAQRRQLRLQAEQVRVPRPCGGGTTGVLFALLVPLQRDLPLTLSPRLNLHTAPHGHSQAARGAGGAGGAAGPGGGEQERSCCRG